MKWGIYLASKGPDVFIFRGTGIQVAGQAHG